MGTESLSKRRKKRSLSQKRSKKKIRRNKDKTKKPKRRHDSVSCSEEDSVSNSSLTLHSSEDEHRGRKRARSRDRKDRKKKAKRGSLVSESSSDDDSPVIKKRKKSKTSKDSESRKKRHGKKHRKRSPSVSSLSERSDGGEKEVERKERKKGKEKRGSKRRVKGKERSSSKRKRRSKSRSPSCLRSESHSYGSEDKMVGENNSKRSVGKRKHRSKSRSPCSLHSESDGYASEDRVVNENHAKRLKSVIVVPHENDEGDIRESNWDGNKAEIVFEHDEYPSRSNDSNDGVIRRDASSFFHDVSSRIPGSVYDIDTEVVHCDVQTSKIPESQSIVTEKNEVKGNGIRVSVETVSSNGDDLAAVLRQKALENFLKRQAKSSAKKGDVSRELNSPSSLKTDEVPLSGIKSVQKLGKDDEVNNVTDIPSSSKVDNNNNKASLPRHEPGIRHLTEKYTAPSGFADSRTKLGLPTPRKEFIGARNTWRRQESVLPNSEQSMGKDIKQETVSAEYSQPNVLIPKKAITKGPYTAQKAYQPHIVTLTRPVDGDSKRKLTSQEASKHNPSVPEDGVDLGPSKVQGSSCLDSSTVTASQPTDMVEQGANETDGDSQFQQKTMSVMRGGEMVQVSYKVYIPKKVPALARRLKR